MEETVTLRVRDGVTEMLFKVRKVTQMLRVKEAYCSKKGVDLASVRFSIDGEILNDSATAASLELEENDVIEVTLLSGFSNIYNASSKAYDTLKTNIMNELEESLNRNASQPTKIDVLYSASTHLIINGQV